MKTMLTALLLACVLGMTTPDAAAQERLIMKSVTVKAPVEEVWKAWSTSEGIKSFFAPDARVEARPGGPFEVYVNPYARPGLKGADDMVVLAVQDKAMISFTWNAPPHLVEARRQRTSVVVRMKPAGEGMTEVRLTHGGWGDGGQWDQAYDYFDKAWGNVLASLQKRFAEGPVDWTTWLKQMRAFQDSVDAREGAAKKP